MTFRGSEWVLGSSVRLNARSSPSKVASCSLEREHGPSFLSRVSPSAANSKKKMDGSSSPPGGLIVASPDGEASQAGALSPNEEKRQRVDKLRAKLQDQKRVVDEIRGLLATAVSPKTKQSYISQSSPSPQGTRSSFPNTPSAVPATQPRSRYARDGATHSAASRTHPGGASSPSTAGEALGQQESRERVRILAETSEERDHDLDIPYETAVRPPPHARTQHPRSPALSPSISVGLSILRGGQAACVCAIAAGVSPMLRGWFTMGRRQAGTF